jgi:hypothetical protein
MNSLDDVKNIPEDSDPLLRNRRQQAILAQMALDAAEQRWPGFNDTASEIVAEEKRLLLERSPQG